jgi:hypothetical protein
LSGFDGILMNFILAFIIFGLGGTFLGLALLGNNIWLLVSVLLVGISNFRKLNN